VWAAVCEITFVDVSGGEDGAADLGDQERSVWEFPSLASRHFP
jgi:hypothetical protein